MTRQFRYRDVLRPEFMCGVSVPMFSQRDRKILGDIMTESVNIERFFVLIVVLLHWGSPKSKKITNIDSINTGDLGALRC